MTSLVMWVWMMEKTIICKIWTGLGMNPSTDQSWMGIICPLTNDLTRKGLSRSGQACRSRPPGGRTGWGRTSRTLLLTLCSTPCAWTCTSTLLSQCWPPDAFQQSAGDDGLTEQVVWDEGPERRPHLLRFYAGMKWSFVDARPAHRAAQGDLPFFHTQRDQQLEEVH